MRVAEKIRLWQSDKCIVEIDKNALALPILLDNERKGYVFHGNCKLVLDTIVETDKGAIGRPIEREINAPFLMIGNTKEIGPKLAQADNKELKDENYDEEETFRAKADELRHCFLGKGIHFDFCLDDECSSIFAFPNNAEGLDVLVAKNNKIVYKAKSTVFVSNKDKTVLKTPFQMVLSNDRKSFIIKK